MCEADGEDDGAFFVGGLASFELLYGDAEVGQHAQRTVEGSFADAGGFGCGDIEAGHEDAVLAGEGGEDAGGGDGRLRRDSACGEDLRSAGDLCSSVREPLLLGQVAVPVSVDGLWVDHGECGVHACSSLEAVLQDTFGFIDEVRGRDEFVEGVEVAGFWCCGPCDAEPFGEDLVDAFVGEAA